MNETALGQVYGPLFKLNYVDCVHDIFRKIDRLEICNTVYKHGEVRVNFKVETKRNDRITWVTNVTTRCEKVWAQGAGV